MRNNTFTLALMVFMILNAYADQTYQLVWSDEFNGNSLDLSKWQYEVNCDGGGNNELQCYTNSPNNVAVRNGSLVITAQIQDLNGKHYTSGRINTAHSAAWKYGRFDARAKLPEGIYFWPALWMMPRDSVYGSWAASGEIDIMENRGGNNREQQSTLHFGGGWPKNIYQGSGPTTMSFDMTKDFHVYSAIWTPQSIQFLVDGNNYYTMNLDRSFNNAAAGSYPYTKNGQPFDQYFYYIINFAIGGGFFGANSQSLTTAQARAWPNPQFEVDYVRVYQLQDSVVAAPSPAATHSSAVVTPLTPVASTHSSTAAATHSSTTAANAASSNNGGCTTNNCGSNSCCMDQSGSQHCYNPSQYSCPVDQFSGKHALCPTGFGACNGACFSPAHYTCNNGQLQSI